MKELFDVVSVNCSKLVTRTYSTSFSLGIYFLSKTLHSPIYSIYGFVRLADEIVDSFHNYDKLFLLDNFKLDTYQAIEDGISLNPILNGFQKVVRKYNIDLELVDQFLKSMEMDLNIHSYDRKKFDEYVLGSAEVVGLMCLKVFTQGNNVQYLSLKPYAMKLGAAFQKINFLRDLQNDYQDLGRNYFPGISFENFGIEDKRRIEKEICKDFNEGLKGIKLLPKNAKLGVYIAYVYYLALFKKIKKVPPEKVMKNRIRIPNGLKFSLMINSFLKYKLKII